MKKARSLEPCVLYIEAENKDDEAKTEEIKYCIQHNFNRTGKAFKLPIQQIDTQ